MITEFDLDACRDSAVIYSSVLEQIEMLYEDDTELAGEFAIAAIQTVLSGDTTTDNKMIKVMLKQLQQSALKNQERYELSRESKREYKAKDLRLEEIAELVNEGLSVREIEQQLDIPKSTVSYRLGIIKKDYPELLSNEVSNCPTCPTYVTDTVTDTVTVTDTDTYTDNDNDSEKVVGFGQAERQPASVNASDVTYDEYILSLIKKYKPFKNNSGMIAFQEVPMFSEMEQINSYLSMHPEVVNAA